MSSVTSSPITSSDSKRKMTFVISCTVMFLFWVSLYLYMPTLPSYVQSRSDDLALVGVVLSMYGLWQAIFRLPFGVLSDWLNRRRPFIIIGMLLSAAGSWMMGIAGGPGLLIVGRSLTGLAASFWVIFVVVFGNLFPPERVVQATSILTLIGSIARMLSTASHGPLIEAGGYSMVFNGAAIAAAIGALLAFALPEKRISFRAPNVHSTLALISRRDVWSPACLNSVIQYMVWGIPFSFLPILARQMGASGTLLGVYTTINLALTAGGNLVAAMLARKMKNSHLGYASFILMVSAVAAAAFAQSLNWILVIYALTGFAQGIGYPVLMGMSIAHVDSNERATAMGFHQAVYAVGIFAGPWLSGILADAFGMKAMFLITVAGCVALAGFFGKMMAVEPEAA